MVHKERYIQNDCAKITVVNETDVSRYREVASEMLQKVMDHYERHLEQDWNSENLETLPLSVYSGKVGEQKLLC